MTLDSLRLEAYSDRELMLVVRDLAIEDGWVEPEVVAQQLGIETASPRGAVTSRFVWMRRYGAMERELEADDDGTPVFTRAGRVKVTSRWRLTPRGEALALGVLDEKARKQLDALTEDQMLLLTRWVAEKRRDVNEVAATLMRREWRYSNSALRNGLP